MKNLYFTLLGTGGTSDVPGFYLPGDTLGGRIHLATSSRVKYTCLLIQFVGTVKTKVAKAEEQIYVLNLQSVLLGNPDNTDEQVIGEGKHSWPFQFTIPQHHIPSSGKYRHSTVKYSISASFVSKGFLGKIRSLKASQTITIKDLINVKVEPYSLPVLARGKSNLQPDTNDPRNFATASVKLPRSAFLKGQKVQIEIDLYHPSKIQRNSGCIIELIKKESYYAGDCAKEYTNTIANCSAPLIVNSPVNSGKIMSEVIIPDSALPTMAATKAILVEYHLNILLDMRPKTGLLDLRNKTIKGKDRTQFLTIPGCFEVQIPITIGTTSDSLYTPRLGPFAQSPTLHHSMTPPDPLRISFRIPVFFTYALALSTNVSGTPRVYIQWH
ncbi:hypothetical protein BGX31_009763 [Mortierella sp. GBA43]|nr:hypothetical protein BGX31_009763 [Mortierella sp. GBA43]